MANKTSRQLQAEETKRNIFMIVANTMSDKNFEDIKIRDICEKAGIAVGTFYHYFPSKEAVILYSAREMDDRLNQIDMDGTPLENIEKFIKGFFDIVIVSKGFEIIKQIVTCRLMYYDEYYLDESRPMFCQLYEQVETLAREGQNPKKLTWRILNFCRGCQYNLCTGPADIDISSWYSEQIEHTMGYIDYLINHERLRA